ncbi:AAA family ATPase [Candidatus Poribacteria bacterium]|nr:AAA family ATPase [Candidatus Poribacteria bacterium]
MRHYELYKYNPGQYPPEEIEATFVCREAMLEEILNVLRERTTTPTNQHFLIIGPRGIGKTTLLLMVRHRVTSDESLNRAYVPIQTAEEEYSIASLRDFFARILSLLMEREGSHALDSAAQSVNACEDDERAAEIAIAALKDFCQREDRKLLLLVDNLDLILGAQLTDDAEMGRLRDLLMNESFLVLVGAAPTYFAEVSGYDRPLYNFFRLIELEELSAEGMAELLRRRAERDNNRAMLDQFAELQPRIRAIHHLTGGNPRLALMLYQLYAHTQVSQVRAALQMLLDDLTPYYKGRLEGLALQQRKVIDTFARLGRPATPTELAEQTRLPVNQVNTILQRLRALGFVEVAPQERRRGTLYIVSERVFRIWHQMRFSTASRRRLEFFIEFIRIWYTAEEWEEEADRLMGEYSRTASEKRYEEAGRFVEYLEHLAAAAPDVEWGDELADDTVRACIDAGDFDRAEEILTERIREQTREGNHDRLALSWFRMADLRDSQGRLDEAIAGLEKAVQFNPNDHVALYNWGVALADLAFTQTGAERERLLRQACEKYEAALQVKPDDDSALYNWGVALDDLARTQTGAERKRLLRQAGEKYEAALQAKPDDDDALNNWGLALADLALTQTGAEQERLLWQAGEKYEAALQVKPDHHEALYNWGNALADVALTQTGPEQERLLRQAGEKYEAALQVKPDKHEALNNWGIALRDLAQTKTGIEQAHLLEIARGKVHKAIQIATSQGNQARVAFYSTNFVYFALYGCASAIEAENLGDARHLFNAALDVLPQAEPERAHEDLVTFFRRVVREERADFCGALLDAMRARGRERELGVLEPFAIAIQYWKSGKDAEILDRLNPEVRQLVEAIIHGT